MRTLVPYDARDPKTRLSPVFDDRERRTFARLMLDNVLSVLERAGHDSTVLATAAIDCDCPVIVDSRPLSVAVNSVLDDWERPAAIVMADVPLVTVQTVRTLLDDPGDIVIAPGLGGGTNALVIRHPEFRVDYHGTSYRDHRRQANELGGSFSTVDSFRLAVDVDEPEDLVEVLLHGRNEVSEWLRETGITLVEKEGRTTLSTYGESGQSL